MSLRGHRALVARGAVHDGALSSLHGCSTVALVGADGAGATAGRQSRDTGLTLQLAKDGFFVREKVPDQAVAVAFVHGQTALEARAENARGQNLGQGGSIGLVGGCEVKEAREMGHDGVECCNIVETELSECALQDLDASLFCGLVSRRGINRLDNFVDLCRNN